MEASAVTTNRLPDRPSRPDEPPNLETLTRQCDEAGKKILATLFTYPKDVAACVLPGVLATVMRVLSIPRETVVAMLDAALEDIANGERQSDD